MKYRSTLALLCFSLIWAQTPLAFGATQPASGENTGTAPPPSFTAPSAAGSPHVCDQSVYPPAALAAGEEGAVGLAFRIGTDGSPKNVTVSSTSGYADLDQAAISCAAQWKYSPAMQSGHPVEADWKAVVHWSIQLTAETAAVTRGDLPISNVVLSISQQIPIGSQVCKNPSSPPKPLGKFTFVAFRIAADGSVNSVRLFKSSGDHTLDGYGIACVNAWRFTALPAGAHRAPSLMLAPLPW
jgi:TonB family protein